MLRIFFPTLCGLIRNACFVLILAANTLLPSAIEAAPVPEGCASTVSADFTAGFDPTHYDLTSVAHDVDTGALVLQTGFQAIVPENIVIPFEQEVWASFLYENAGFTSTLGWMLYEDAVDVDGDFLGWASIPDSAKHPIFVKVDDDSGVGGVLDSVDGWDEEKLSMTADPNGGEGLFVVDGDDTVGPNDMRKSLGRFAAGTELVFWLASDRGNWGAGDSANVFYTKKEWNPDTFTSCKQFDGTHQRFYRFGDAITANGCDELDKGVFDAAAITRLSGLGLSFRPPPDDVKTLSVTPGSKFEHSMAAAPQEDPNQWVLAWEDYPGGGDMDFNDILFRLERKTGGAVGLKPAEAIVPSDADSFYTAVNFGIYDEMPDGACLGEVAIDYFVSIDNGVNWVTVRNEDWDTVNSFTLNNGTKELGDPVVNWTPGAPTRTYREVRLDFAGQNLTGRQLLWKASLKSDAEACVPKIYGTALSGNTSANGTFSRAAPSKLVNALYSSSYETPAIDWADRSHNRGHVKARRLYDPVDPSVDDSLQLWDAGAVLASLAPDSRSIYYPDIVLSAVLAEALELERPDGSTTFTGDGVSTEFKGQLASSPIIASTVSIKVGGIWEFVDKGTDSLQSDWGYGKIDRFSGEFELVFNNPPANGVQFLVDYGWYQTSPVLLEFTTANIDNATLTLDNTFIVPDGYIYDLDGDGDFDEADGDWLVEWMRGYADGHGRSVEKEWKLGPIDHSRPTILSPPGRQEWYYGTATRPEERYSFNQFRENFMDRPVVLFVGSRDGMLHAFDAGQFRWGDNPETVFKEKLGYFLWVDPGTGTLVPDYGDGQELWAFLPANLLPRVKNNLLGGDDQAFVDASATIAQVQMDTVSSDAVECVSRGGTQSGGLCLSGWKSLLLMAEGNGGDTIFSLDVTNPLQPKFMWEFSDPDLFRSRVSPDVGKIGRINVNGESKWAAFFVSGKTNDPTLYPSIYVIDVSNGSVIERIFLNSDAAGQGGVPSGSPKIIDADRNGYIDRIYVGTDKGLVYKVNISDDPQVNLFAIDNLVINHDFVDDDGDVDGAGNPIPLVVPVDQRWHPIYASPTVVNETIINSSGYLDYKIRIFFGTGDSPYYDEDIDTGNTTYSFFSYVDDAPKGESHPDRITLDWFYALPAGQRVFSSAFANAGKIYFGTSSADTENPCELSNDGAVYVFDFNQVGAPAQPLRTISGTGNITSGLLVSNSNIYNSGKEIDHQEDGGEPDVPTLGVGQYERKAWREVE